MVKRTQTVNFSTHMKMRFSRMKKTTSEAVSNASADSVITTDTKTDEQPTYSDTSLSTSKSEVACAMANTQTKLRQKTLTETADINKKSSSSNTSRVKKGAKSHDKQGEKRKPSQTPEKEKMSKLMKVFTKK